MDLGQAMQISGSGMRAQSARMKVITENIANADSILGENGQEPYRKQLVFLQPVTNSQTGASEVQLVRIEQDFNTPFTQEYNPTHPLANAEGFIQKPNVNTLMESADLREAARSYEANLSAIETTKQMMRRTADILR